MVLILVLLELSLWVFEFPELKKELEEVLILVLLELSLWDLQLHLLATPLLCLNPCFTGT